MSTNRINGSFLRMRSGICVSHWWKNLRECGHLLNLRNINRLAQCLLLFGYCSMIYLVEFFFYQKTVIGHQVKFALEANHFDAFSFLVPILRQCNVNCVLAVMLASLSICLLSYLSAFLPGCRMGFLSVSLSICLSVCLSVCQPACLPVSCSVCWLVAASFCKSYGL